MDEFVRELFYYCTVEAGKLSKESTEEIARFLEVWGELERTGSNFNEWLHDSNSEEEFKKFEKALGI